MLACAKTSRSSVISTKLRFISAVTHPQWKFIRLPCLSKFSDLVPIASSQSSAALPKGMQLVFSTHDGWAVHTKEISELSYARRNMTCSSEEAERMPDKEQSRPLSPAVCKSHWLAPPLKAHKVLLSEPQI